MPVRMRLATKGQIRNGRISIRSPCLLRSLEGLDQQSDIVIEELKVVCHFFLSAHRGQVLDDLTTSVASNGLGSFQVEVGLHQDYLAILALHEADQFDGVA